MNIQKPSGNIICIQKQNLTSTYEDFLTIILNTDNLSEILQTIIHLIGFLPQDRNDPYITFFLSKLSYSNVRSVLPKLPISTPVFIKYADLLLSEKTFYGAFTYLFGSFNHFSKEAENYVIRSFRCAIEKCIGTKYFENMLDFIFLVPKHDKGKTSPFEVFFNAITDNSLSIIQYCASVDLDQIFSKDKIQFEVPRSFLRFLIFTSANYNFSADQIWQLAQTAPSLLFQYVAHLNSELSKKTWSGLLERCIAAKRTSYYLDVQTSILRHFLAALNYNQNLMNIFLEKKVHQWMVSVLTTFSRTRHIGPREEAFIGVSLCVCRFSEKAAVTFKDSIPDQNSSYFGDLGLDSPDLADLISWLLEPSQSFPLEDVAVTENAPIFPNSCPSYTFCSFIIPSLFKALLNLNSNDLTVFQIINNSLKNNVHRPMLLKDIPIENNIHKLLEFQNNEALDFVISVLSVQCNFEIFQSIYKSVSNSPKLTIEFLSKIVDRTPIVDDFLFIDRSYPLQAGSIQVSNGTLCLWMHCLTQTASLLTISDQRRSLTITHDSNHFYAQTGKDYCELPLGKGIDGWHFLTLRFERDITVLSVDLEQIQLSIGFKTSVSIIIGGNNGSYSMQSIRLFRPPLSKNDELYLFSLGPNTKEFIWQNFMALKEPIPQYADGISFISELYADYALKLTNIKANESIFGQPFQVFSITTPFQGLFMMRRSSITHESSDSEFWSIHKRCCLTPFINSFDAVGGVSLLAHLVAECILKHKELQESMFKLLILLVNKFPIYHYAMISNKIYKAIGQLLWDDEIDSETLMRMAYFVKDKHMVLSNVMALKYFMLGPPLYHCDLSVLMRMLRTSIDSEYGHRNQKLLRNLQAVKFIVRAITNSNIHRREFLELLVDIMMVLTDKRDAQDIANFVFSHIMINHLSFSLQETTDDNDEPKTPLSELRNRSAIPISQRSTRSAVALLSFIAQLMDRFELQVPIQLLLGGFTTSSIKVQIAMLNLLLRRLKSEHHYLFGVAIMNMPESSKIAEYLFSFTQAMAHSKIFEIHHALLPMLYLVSHGGFVEYLYAASTAAVSALPYVNNIRDNNFDHLVNIILCACTVYEGEGLIVPSLMTKASNGIEAYSSTVSPLCLLIVSLLTRSLELDLEESVKKFFVALFALKSVPEYHICTVSLFVISKLLEGLLSVSNTLAEFALSYGSFVFTRIHLIPGDTTEILSSSILYFVRIMLRVSDRGDKNLISKTLECLTDLSILNTISPLASADVKSHTKLSKNRKFSETIDRLENPTSYVPPKSKKPPFETLLKRYEEVIANRPQNDSVAMLTACCNAIYYQTNHGKDIDPSGSSIDTHIETWRSIFNTLLFPGSGIFEGCPSKYTVDDTTTKIAIRKVLRLLNPACDPTYLSNWEAKYGKTLKPEIRLTLGDVLKFNRTLFRENDVIFTTDAVRLTGISIFKGVLVVTSNSIKFYQKPKGDTPFNDILILTFSQIRSVRAIQFQHQPRGLIVEEYNGGYYIFAVDAQSLHDRLFEVFQSLKIPIHRGIDKGELKKATQAWIDRKISSFDYIMKLNLMSGRTWSDFTQYPIFPWTIIDFESEKPEELRDLRFPIFAQTEGQRVSLDGYYEATQDMGSAYHFPNYISNVGSSLYYLVRLEPYIEEEVTFQNGSLDAADRTFQSLQITKELMMKPGAKSALELVPEFYYLPEMFENVNEIEFPVSPINKRDISEVSLPPWAHGSPNRLVNTLRKALESESVSRDLHEWIDLIWGIRRDGPKALERWNVLQRIIFDFEPEQYRDDRVMMKAVVDQIHNCGQAPIQLFTQPHPKRPAGGPRGRYELRKAKVELAGDHSDGRSFSGWQRFSNGMKAKISMNSIELTRPSGSLRTFVFAEEIKPTCIDIDGMDAITAHRIPVLNHWIATEAGLRHVSLLRGRMSTVTAAKIVVSSRLAIAGHIDGFLSIFSLFPHVFLREIKLPLEGSVDFVYFQNHIFAAQTNRVTAVSSNGRVMGTAEFESSVVDVTASAFAEGTRKNIIVVLMDDKLVVCSANSLRRLQEISTEPGNAAVSMWKNLSVLVTKNDRTVERYDIIQIS